MLPDLRQTGSELDAGDALSPRERLLARGAAALSTAELLSLCLRTGAPGVPVLWVAQALLAEFGGIAALLEAPPQRLLALPGLGPAKVATLYAGVALAERRASEPLSRQRPLGDSAAAVRFVQNAIGHQGRELFGCLFLDARHRPLGFEILFAGSVDRAHVHPRELLKRVLTYNASAVILAHNHPSGVCEPSASDRALTTRLTRLLAEIDVRVIDHIIVGGEASASLAALGMLEPSVGG